MWLNPNFTHKILLWNFNYNLFCVGVYVNIAFLNNYNNTKCDCHILWNQRIYCDIYERFPLTCTSVWHLRFFSFDLKNVHHWIRKFDIHDLLHDKHIYHLYLFYLIGENKTHTTTVCEAFTLQRLRYGNEDEGRKKNRDRMLIRSQWAWILTMSHQYYILKHESVAACRWY